jgi:hypothetical protein
MYSFHDGHEIFRCVPTDGLRENAINKTQLPRKYVNHRKRERERERERERCEADPM